MTEILAHGRCIAAKPKSIPPGRFRSGLSVMADTIANKTYDLRLDTVKESALQARKERPRLSACAEFVTRYAFWVPLALLSNRLAKQVGQGTDGIIHHLGPVAVYSIAAAHVCLVSAGVRHVLRKGLPGPSEHPKPSLSTYIGSFAAVDPLYIFTNSFAATLVIGLSSDTVRPLTAMAGVVLGTAVGLIVDCAGFCSIWTWRILRDLPHGTLGDEIRGIAKGIASGFRPLDAFRGKYEPNPAKGPGEYAGQLWGVMESHFLWVQGLRLVFAAATALQGVEPAMFMSQLWSNMSLYLFDLMIGPVIAGYYKAIDRKIEENNRCLLCGDGESQS